MGEKTDKENTDRKKDDWDGDKRLIYKHVQANKRDVTNKVD